MRDIIAHAVFTRCDLFPSRFVYTLSRISQWQFKNKKCTINIMVFSPSMQSTISFPKFPGKITNLDILNKLKIELITLFWQERSLSPHPPESSCLDSKKLHAFFMLLLFSYVLPQVTRPFTPNHVPYVKHTPHDPYLNS